MSDMDKICWIGKHQGTAYENPGGECGRSAAYLLKDPLRKIPIPICKIHAAGLRRRKHFDEGSITELK